MGNFLREYWVWIVAPIVLVAALLIAVLILGGGEDSPFIYNIF